MPVLSGRWLNSLVKASNPPAEAPTQTMYGSVLLEDASTAPESVAGGRGKGAAFRRGRLPAFFTTDHHFSFRGTIGLCRPAGRSGCGGTREQIFQRLTDLHELIQTGRLRDELGHSQVPEQHLVPTGTGRTPNAYWHSNQVPGISNLAQDVFACIFRQ